MNKVLDSLKSFDEETYLKSNPDVSKAVQNGAFFSGWDHYIHYGFRANRPGVLPDVYKAIRDLAYPPEPVPPQHIRERIKICGNLPNFEEVGRITSLNMYAAINALVEFGDQCYILDFGCGCGRVMKYFHRLAFNSRLYGTDIDKEAIAWCQQYLSHIGEFIANDVVPPLPFDDDLFDFVYAISVFTHLPEDMQFAWLEELRRVTKPGGYLLLTTHGEELFLAAPEESKRRFREEGFHYSVGPGKEGLPYFYQTSFHTRDYIHSRWSKFFEIKKIIKKGMVHHQDLILCRKPH